MQAVTAILGLGSNQGDRMANLYCAVEHLMAAGVQITAVSPLYESEPWGVANQPAFLNAAVRTTVTLSPADLLRVCKKAEKDCGRGVGPRWGPRAIDIDILTYGSSQLDEPNLQIPHPRLAERRFALVPWQQVAAADRLPDGQAVTTALAKVAQQGLRRIMGPQWLAQRRRSP